MSVCQCENLTYLLGFDVLQQSQPFETEDRFVKYVNFDFEPKYRTKRFLIFAGTLIPVGKDDGCNRDVIVKVRRERPAADDYWGFYFARSGISRNVLARFDRVVDEELGLDIEFVDEYEAKFSGYTQWNEFMMQFKDFNHRTLTSGEHIVVEPYLHGHFQNFDKTPDAIMDSLAHFSYHTSRGQYILHGLKGVELDGSYRLTVPLIHSINKDFGPRDMAMEGITRFFKNHNCTDICHGWSKPELTDINMNTKDIGVRHKTDRNLHCHRNDTRDANIEKVIADEGIYNSISDPENEGSDERKADDDTTTSKEPQEEKYHYAKVNKKPKDKGLEEVDLSENMEMTSEDASVYGGSQDTGYSSIRELKDFQFEKDHHGDEITSHDTYLNDPDETAVIGLGNINMYNNEKFGLKYNSGFVDIHQHPEALYREYENERVTTTAIIHSENRERGPEEKGRDSKEREDVYDTIESVDLVQRDMNKLSLTEHSQMQNTVV